MMLTDTVVIKQLTPPSPAASATSRTRPSKHPIVVRDHRVSLRRRYHRTAESADAASRRAPPCDVWRVGIER